jgi:hypothetical protein
VEEGTPLAKTIARANIGIVWHTTYEGKTIAELKPTFGHAITNKFKKTMTGWMEDATLTDVTGAATFTDKERKAFDAMLSEIGRWFQSMPAATLNAIHKDETLLTLIHTYNNSKIRAGQRVTDPVAHVDGLYQFIHDRYQKEIDKLKTDAGKGRKDAEREKVLSFFAAHPRKEIVRLFVLAMKIADAKQVLIDKLNKASSISTFLKTSSGFRVTSAEGFVAIGSHGATKLVDRMEFSMANFSPEIIKGWQR